jgi:uncharacterized integral membrane protein
MNIRALALAVAFALLALFAFLNWEAFTSPTALNLGFTEVSAPLGLTMLIVTAVISGLFFIYIVVQQAGFIMESRRTAKELKSQRELADKAEASRFTELRGFLEGELRRVEAQSAASTKEFGARVEQIEQGLQQKLTESTRTLTAFLGEIEDKLDRVLPQART